MAEPLYVDSTLLRDVAHCSMKSVLRHLLGRATVQERAELLVGKAIHEALALFLGSVDPEKALALFDAVYTPARELIVDERFQPSNVRTILWRWLVAHERGFDPLRIDKSLIEVPFVVPVETKRFDRPLYYTGRLDALGVDVRDDWWVLEHKTTRRISDYWRERWRLDAQVTGYEYAARVSTGHKVVGIMMNALQISKLPSDPRKKCKSHGVVYQECRALHAEWALITTTRTETAIEQWHRDVEHLAQRYLRLVDMVHTTGDLDRVRQQGLWNFSCPFCQFHDWCLAGRQPALLETMTVHDPWSPLPPERAERGEAPAL